MQKQIPPDPPYQYQIPQGQQPGFLQNRQMMYNQTYPINQGYPLQFPQQMIPPQHPMQMKYVQNQRTRTAKIPKSQQNQILQMYSQQTTGKKRGYNHTMPKTPTVSPNIPQPPPQPNIIDFPQNPPVNHEAQAIQLLSTLNDETADFLFQIIGCTAPTRIEKEKYFITTILPSTPSPQIQKLFYLFTHSKPSEIKKLREPYVPILFNSLKVVAGSISYHLVPFSVGGIDYHPPFYNPNLMCIGSFICPYINKQTPVNSIILNGKEIFTTNFGSNEKYFVLITDLSKNTNIRISFQPSINAINYLTWFVIQLVEKKQISLIIREITPKSKQGTKFNEHTLFAKTEKCKNCLFLVKDIILDFFNSGSCTCPTCGAEINLNHLKFVQRQNMQNIQPKPPEEDPMLSSAQQYLGSVIGPLFDISDSNQTNQWFDTVFKSDGIQAEEYHEMEYLNAGEYIRQLYEIE
ncbi:uncharacterized protein GO595_008817 [Histomonas meleagridis]|uniref:uncharacterized protein n=1 Tax=Histomonas meleagridis TaxID=135588 RepID=UPI00355A1407|nr:hypothetical protein GO595_008817 [Histomonas meleagridis]